MGQAKASGSEINSNAIDGTILKYLGTYFKAIDHNIWIIYTRASEHMCYNFSSFLSLTPLPTPVVISLPNYFKIMVTHTDSISIQANLTLNGVIYVSYFKYNLLSIHKLCCQFQCSAYFNSFGCMLQALSMKRGQAFGEVKEGLYILQQASSELRSLLGKM